MNVLVSLIVASCLSWTSLYGTWRNDGEAAVFDRDTIRVISEDQAMASAWKRDRRVRPRRIYLVFDFGDLVVEMPFAIYEISGDTLRMETTEFRGVNVGDYPHIPFPETFTDSGWVFVKEE